ncbi:MAG: hypothetical protein OHK0046_36910 [Anaerolineae bacterium]
MTQIKTYPYLTADPKRVTLVQDWRYLDASGSVEPAEMLENWEPTAFVEADITLRVDLDGIMQDCGLAHDAQLRLVAGWRSSGTMLRGQGSRVDLNSKNASELIRLKVRINGTDVARDIMLFAAVILVDAGFQPEALSPTTPGSVIWVTEHILLLEDEFQYFPIELTDFSAKDWLVPADAAWYLEWDAGDLYQIAHDDVKLYLNSVHNVVLEALADNQSTSDVFENFLLFDIARNLILGALANPQFVEDPLQYPDDTIGAVINGLIREYFPDYTVTSLYKMSQNRSLFEAQLQHYLRFLRD